MDDLDTWKARLEAQFRSQHAGIAVDEWEGCLEVVVWSESDAGVAWSIIDQLGVPEALVRVVKPIAYLEPYPGQDQRNETAFQEFLSKNLRTGKDGQQLLLSGLDPVVGRGAHVLLLGSMPGALSLKQGEYYAHPRNRFWTVMERVLSIPAAEAYERRVKALTEAGVALWDVLSSCTRVGSLDRRINPETEVPNDIDAFLRSNPTVSKIALNGRKAEQSFKRWIGEVYSGVEVVALPSTSAANAKLSTDALTELWRAALL